MKILLSLLAVLLAVSPAALSREEFFSTVCDGDQSNRRLACGSKVDLLSFDPVSGQVSVTSDTPLSDSAPIFLEFVPTGEAPPPRENYYLWGGQRIASPTDIVVVPEGVAGQLCGPQMRGVTLGQPVCSSTFTKLPGAGLITVNLRPGAYVANGASKAEVYQDPARTRTRLLASQVCKNPNIKGILIGIDGWMLIERYVDGVAVLDFSIIHQNVDVLMGEECNAARNISQPFDNLPTFMLRPYVINFGGSAGRGECVPEDVRGTFNPDLRVFVYEGGQSYNWYKGRVVEFDPALGRDVVVKAGAARCAANFLGHPELKQRYYDMVEGIALTFGVHPQFEAFMVKGESAFGLGASGNPPGLDTTANVIAYTDDFLDVMEEGMRVFNQHAPHIPVIMGYNSWGGSPTIHLPRIARFEALCEELIVCGFTYPDAFNTENDTQSVQPVTHFYARAHDYRSDSTVPRKNKWLHIGSMQIMKNRCKRGVQTGIEKNGTDDCWNVGNQPGFQHTRADFDANDMVNYPSLGETFADGYQGLANTHTVYAETGGSSYSLAAMKATWEDANYETYAMNNCTQLIEDSPLHQCSP